MESHANALKGKYRRLVLGTRIGVHGMPRVEIVDRRAVLRAGGDPILSPALREALENLSYRERRVLELRYGLGGEHPRTLDEVGRTFNVTRERIRQIENQSLKKLRALADSQKLRDVA